MGPKSDRELVQVRDDQSSGIWPHGRPFRIICLHLYFQPRLRLVTATTACMHVGGLVLTGPNLPHEGMGDVAGGGSVTGRTLALGLHEAEPGMAHTCHQARSSNVSHLNPRVLAAKGMPPARVRSLHRSGARFAAAA